MRSRLAAIKRKSSGSARRLRVRSLLSAREKEVLSWLKQGKTSWAISVILNISERTVNYHIGNILRKLGVCNRTHAVAESVSASVQGTVK